MQPGVRLQVQGPGEKQTPLAPRDASFTAPVPDPGSVSGSTFLSPQDLLCHMGERVIHADALQMCGWGRHLPATGCTHVGVSETDPAPPRDGGGSRLFRRLLRSQGTRVRTVTSPGCGERLFISSCCLCRRVVGCLVHPCTSAADTGSGCAHA